VAANQNSFAQTKPLARTLQLTAQQQNAVKPAGNTSALHKKLYRPNYIYRERYPGRGFERSRFADGLRIY